MSELLDNLKSADDALHAEVAAIGDAVTQASARVSNDLAALNQRITDLNASGALNVNEVQGEIARIQGETAAIGTQVAAITAIDAPVSQPVADPITTEPSVTGS